MCGVCCHIQPVILAHNIVSPVTRHSHRHSHCPIDPGPALKTGACLSIAFTHHPSPLAVTHHTSHLSVTLAYRSLSASPIAPQPSHSRSRSPSPSHPLALSPLLTSTGEVHSMFETESTRVQSETDTFVPSRRLPSSAQITNEAQSPGLQLRDSLLFKTTSICVRVTSLLSRHARDLLILAICCRAAFSWLNNGDNFVTCHHVQPRCCFK